MEPKTITEVRLNSGEPAWSRLHRERNRLVGFGIATRDTMIKAMIDAKPGRSAEIQIDVDPTLPPGTVEFRYGEKVVGRIANIGTDNG